MIRRKSQRHRGKYNAKTKYSKIEITKVSELNLSANEVSTIDGKDFPYV